MKWAWVECKDDGAIGVGTGDHNGNADAGVAEAVLLGIRGDGAPILTATQAKKLICHLEAAVAIVEAREGAAHAESESR